MRSEECRGKPIKNLPYSLSRSPPNSKQIGMNDIYYNIYAQTEGILSNGLCRYNTVRKHP